MSAFCLRPATTTCRPCSCCTPQAYHAPNPTTGRKTACQAQRAAVAHGRKSTPPSTAAQSLPPPRPKPPPGPPTSPASYIRRTRPDAKRKTEPSTNRTYRAEAMSPSGLTNRRRSSFRPGKQQHPRSPQMPPRSNETQPSHARTTTTRKRSASGQRQSPPRAQAAAEAMARRTLLNVAGPPAKGQRPDRAVPPRRHAVAQSSARQTARRLGARSSHLAVSTAPVATCWNRLPARRVATSSTRTRRAMTDAV